MTIAEKQSKIHTKRAKVELAIYDSVYKQQQQDLATKSLEQLINSYVDIEPSLLPRQTWRVATGNSADTRESLVQLTGVRLHHQLL